MQSVSSIVLLSRSMRVKQATENQTAYSFSHHSYTCASSQLLTYMWRYANSLLNNLFRPVNCGDPTAPGNGSIETYQVTTEGAVIFFTCNQMFVPSTRMNATCTSNGMWAPDPGDLTCTCEYLLGRCCIILG